MSQTVGVNATIDAITNSTVTNDFADFSANLKFTLQNLSKYPSTEPAVD